MTDYIENGTSGAVARDIINNLVDKTADLDAAVSSAQNSASSAAVESASAAASAVAADISADLAYAYSGEVLFDDVTALLAYSTLPRLVVGSTVRTRKEGFAYIVVSSGENETTVGGDKLRFVSAGLSVTQSGANSPSYQMGNLYGAIDATVSGSIMFDGRSGYPNKIGVNNTKPTDDPGWGARANDASYVAGGADVAGILAGYDNVNNALAGIIASQHSMLYTGADHASIWGGSLHTIYDDADYSIIAGGLSNKIEGRGRYAAIISGDLNTIETGATDAEAGFRAFIASSTSCTVGGRNGVILGSSGATIQSTYGVVLSGENITLNQTAGSHVTAIGSNITAGATASCTYSFVHGEGITIDGFRCLAVGSGHDIDHDLVVATGNNTKSPFIGARIHASRVRSNTAGNNFSLDFQCSQETTDTTTTRLSINGSATYPTQPASSVVTGTFYVTGVSDAGVCSGFKIDIVSERITTGTPTLRANAVTVLYDGLALPTDPTVNVTTGGIFRVQVVGLAATNIRWDARFVGHCIVY